MPARAFKITTCLAALIAAAVIGASPALAAPGSGWPTNHPLLMGTGPTHSTASQTPPNLPHLDHSVLVFSKGAVASGGTGFDWADAGIGAMTAAAVSIVLFGVLMLDMRRRRVPTAA